MGTTKTDGRTARLDRNRAEIVRAQVERVQETGTLPTADQIAERANVSQRSVYRIFGDKETLLREATDFVYRQLAERFPFPDLGGLPMPERVALLVDHLAAIYEYITPMRRVVARSTIDPEFALKGRERVQAHYLEQIRDAFSDLGVFDEPTPVRLRAFRLIASWNAWDYLRSEGKLSVESAKEVTLHAITAVFRGGASLETHQTSAASIHGADSDGPSHSETQEGDRA